MQSKGRAIRLPEDAVAAENAAERAGEPLDRQLPRVVASLDQPLTADATATLGDLLATDEASIADDVAETLSLEGLEEAIDRRGQLERDVVRLRFGLDGQPPASLESTAKSLGIGVRRVRSLEASALRSLSAQPEVLAFHTGRLIARSGETAEHRREVGGSGEENSIISPDLGWLSRNVPRMQERPRETDRGSSRWSVRTLVTGITGHRPSDRRQVDANLMRASRFKRDVEQRRRDRLVSGGARGIASAARPSTVTAIFVRSPSDRPTGASIEPSSASKLAERERAVAAPHRRAAAGR